MEPSLSFTLGGFADIPPAGISAVVVLVVMLHLTGVVGPSGHSVPPTATEDLWPCGHHAASPSVRGVMRSSRVAVVGGVGAVLWLSSCGGGSSEPEDASPAAAEVVPALTGVELDVRRDPG